MEIVKGQIGSGEFIFETGRIAKQAHGAVLAQCGGSVILAAAVSKKEADESKDFFPLMVDYRERTYAAGKIPGGFFKREGRPTEKEILTSRLIDRPIRSLFPKGYMNDTQIMITVLSVDGENQTDILAMNGASAALLASDIPFDQALGAVRVGLIDGNFVVNPSSADLEKSELDLILAGTKDKVAMIEAGALELTEEKITEAIEFGHKEIRKVVALQEELAKKVGKKKRSFVAKEVSSDIRKKVADVMNPGYAPIFDLPSKEEREEAAKELYKKVLEQFDTEAADFRESVVKTLFDEQEAEILRNSILEKGKRPDGRGFKDIRQLTSEVGVLPRTHGSALFTRGQTQSLSVTTLGTGQDEQRIDSLEGEQSKRFMLHYNFPSFSVGETGPNRGPGRREIGHGALAERGLVAVIPSKDDFPYTIRLVSEIMESNGSSSMATVCAGTLALMDAGVPLKAPVAGIALGLVTDGAKKFQVLTDIAGIEDHHGDMDFKAAGTRKGITTLQMDLKIDGITPEILKSAFEYAKEARFKILDVIEKTISTPREQLSEYAPRVVAIKINPSKIGELIGPGGKNIRKITEETGAKIDIEDDGTVRVAAVDGTAGDAAMALVKGITEEPEIGKVYQGTVRKLMNFGAFCEILPGKDGLCHVSEVSEGFVKSVNEYLRTGDVVPVKVISVDERGKVSLSIKQAKEGGMPVLPDDVEREKIEEPAPRRERSGGGGRGRGRR